MVPDLDRGQQQQQHEQGDEDHAGTTPSRDPPITVPVMDPSVISTRKYLFWPRMAKLLSRLNRANATSIVGRDTAKERRPRS